MEQFEIEWLKRVPSLWSSLRYGKKGAELQNHEHATYCAQRFASDGEINWTDEAVQIDAFIRAQEYPYPRAFFKFNGNLVKVISHNLGSLVIYGRPGQVFQVSPTGVTICCGENSSLVIKSVEIDGRVVNASEIINSIKIRLT